LVQDWYRVELKCAGGSRGTANDDACRKSKSRGKRAQKKIRIFKGRSQNKGGGGGKEEIGQGKRGSIVGERDGDEGRKGKYVRGQK